MEAVSRTTTTDTAEYRNEFQSQSGNSPTLKMRTMLSSVRDDGNA